jgi:putative MATE family efflux protein
MQRISVEPRKEVATAVTGPSPSLPSQYRRLLDGPVLGTLLRLAAPTVALMTLQGLISAGETAFVGRLGASSLAGVSLSFPLVMLMTTLSAGAYGGGVVSAVARALGAGRFEDANRHAGTALTLSAVFGIAFTLAMLLWGRAFYQALGATGSALEAATLYSNILFVGATPFWIFNASASILRAGGNASFPAIAGSIGGVVTLAISPLLIFGVGHFRGFGIAGAAAAVVAYNLVLAMILLGAIWFGRSIACPSLKSLVPQWASAVTILKVSIPSAAGTLLTNLTFIVLTSLVAPFGESAIAGYGSGGRLEYLLIPIVFGIGSALVSLVAASDGAGNTRRVREITRTGAALGAGVCSFAGAIVTLVPTIWMGFFTLESAVTEVGVAYLTRVGIAYPCLGLGLSLYFAAQGKGKTLLPLFASGSRLFVAGVGGAIGVNVFDWTLEALFNLMAVGLLTYALIMVIVMRSELGFGVKTLDRSVFSQAA